MPLETERTSEEDENKPQSAPLGRKRPAMKCGKQRIKRRKQKTHLTTTKPDSMLLGMGIECQSLDEMEIDNKPCHEGCVIFYLEFDDENGLEKFWAFHESCGLSNYLTSLALPDDEMRHIGDEKSLCVKTVALEEDYLAWKHYFNGTRPSRSRKNKHLRVVKRGCIVTARSATDEPRKPEEQLQGSGAEVMDHHAQLVVDMMQQLSLSAATDTPLLGATSAEPHEGTRQRRKSGGRKKHKSGEGKTH
ncbi:hypothetical protein Bbelb_170890 [Branchiostoma belcheri]|nr:hypothetical protein Bbelb_170890 [Branchiostoma belcheri]